MDPEEIGWGAWTRFIQLSSLGQGHVLDQLRSCKLLKRGTVSWS
jgi:hypothetical protein